jgi:KDO2-lipid IV(A) lauroyltransferase
MARLSSAAYSFVSFLAGSMPIRLSYLLGETLGGVLFLLRGKRRRALTANLRVVLGRDRRVGRPALKGGVNFGRAVVETLLVPHLTGVYYEEHVEWSGLEHLDSALARGGGAVLATAHLGSWELAGAALARRGYALTSVAGVQFTAGLSPHLKELKRRLGIEVASPPAGALKLMRALNRGGIVALHIDGDQFFGGIEVEFFGQRTVLPRGPAALAMKSGAALLPAFGLRTGRDRIRIVIEAEVPVRGSGEDEVTRRLLRTVERYIRSHPDQWCMFRALWEDER